MRSQRDTKQWIKAVADFLSISPSELARRAKLSPSTLTRYLNDTTGEIGISQRTLDAIAAESGVPVHQAPPRRGPGLAEADAVPFDYDAETDAAFGRAVRALVQERNGLAPMEIRSFGLDQLGTMPGDVLIVDLNARPKAGDVVCAQVYDWPRDRAETVMRVFEPPYLLTASSRLGVQKPLVVDDETVIVKGVAGAQLRRRRADG